MKTKEVTAIGRKLLPYLPGFVVKGKLLFISPVDDFLRGIYFESSSDPHSFYLRVLFLTLFVPHDSVTFIHGTRIGHALKWRMDNLALLEDLVEVIQGKALPFLNDVSTLDGVLDCLKADVKSDWPRVNSHHLEELAYALIRNAEYAAASESLADLDRRLADSTTPWVAEQRNRAQLIQQKLSQSPNAAIQQLEDWKKETVANLGLEKYQSK